VLEPLGPHRGFHDALIVLLFRLGRLTA
jgi:hypothetical protein